MKIQLIIDDRTAFEVTADPEVFATAAIEFAPQMTRIVDAYSAAMAKSAPAMAQCAVAFKDAFEEVGLAFSDFSLDLDDDDDAIGEHVGDVNPSEADRERIAALSRLVDDEPQVVRFATIKCAADPECFNIDVDSTSMMCGEHIEKARAKHSHDLTLAEAEGLAALDREGVHR